MNIDNFKMFPRMFNAPHLFQTKTLFNISTTSALSPQIIYSNAIPTRAAVLDVYNNSVYTYNINTYQYHADLLALSFVCSCN